MDDGCRAHAVDAGDAVPVGAHVDRERIDPSGPKVGLDMDLRAVGSAGHGGGLTGDERERVSGGAGGEAA
jgi:hypothetical protein